jgi:hypothetical protein
MYDPAWYAEKTLSAVAEAVAVLACAGLVAIRPTRRIARPTPIRARVGSEGKA